MCRSGRFIVAYMDEMIRKLYTQMQMEKEYDDPIEQRMREELRRLLKFQAEHRKAESGQRSEVETEALNEKLQKKSAASYNDSSEIDRLYAAAEVGEEAGFVRGFRYGFRLCMECMQNENIL